MAPPKNRPAGKMLKTSLSLPADLWTQARIRALQEGVDAQVLVARALEAFLKSKGGTR